MTAHHGVVLVAAQVVAAQAAALRVPHLAARPKGVRLQAALVAARQRAAVEVQAAGAVVAQPRENPNHHNLEITVKSNIH
jgi:hypothetical protein